MEKRQIINKIQLRNAAKNNFIAVLNANGVEIKDGFERSGAISILCPSPNHQDRHTGNCIANISNSWAGSVHCFACDYSADAYQLTKDIQGFSTDPEVWEFLSGAIGVPVEYNDGTKSAVTYTPKPKKSEKERILETLSREEKQSAYAWKDYRQYYLDCHKKLFSPAGKAAREYIKKRGISDDLIARLKIGFDYTFGAPRIIIPITKSFYLARDMRSGLSKEQERFSKIKPKGEHIQLFNPEALKGTEPVFIVEGEFDALSIMDMGYQALSLGGVANVKLLEQKLLHIFQKGGKTAPLILALDADEAGRKAAKKFIRETKLLGLLEWGKNAGYCNLDEVGHTDYLFMGCKDANEIFCKNRELFGRALDHVAKKAVKNYQQYELLGE